MAFPPDSLIVSCTGVVGAWDIYRRYPFTICGGVLVAAAPFLSKGN